MFGFFRSAVTESRPRNSEAEPDNSAVHASVASLIRLNEAAASLGLGARSVRARQSGAYLSPFKGRGMEFDEARPYQPGDEIRNLDWRVTARTGKVHTKLFREERERPVFLWVDYRAPMFFATRGVYKSVLAARAASLLAWAASHRGDRVGGVIFSEYKHQEFKPRRGKSTVLNIVKQLAEHPAWGRNDPQAGDSKAIQHAMERLRRVARPGSLIFLISDFRHLHHAAESQLAQIARHSDVVMLSIHDPLEQELPPPGRYRLSNGELEITVNTRDRELLRAYRQRFIQHQEHLQSLSRRLRLYLLSCATTDDPVKILKQGLGVKPS